MAEKILFRAKELRAEKWIEGWYGMQCFGSWPLKHAICPAEDAINGCLRYAEIDPDTLGQYTGLNDKNGKKIFEGDLVDFFGNKAMVTFECGTFGVYFDHGIDYDTMQQHIYDHTSTKNIIHCCFNDNFISLWEIIWNFNCEEYCCDVLEVIGNIHDNPELLKGKKEGE